MLVCSACLSSSAVVRAGCADLSNATKWSRIDSHKVGVYQGETAIALLSIPSCSVFTFSDIKLDKKYTCNGDKITINGEACAIRSVDAPASRERNYLGCESGHWIESISENGKIITLEDGSIWDVDPVDAVDSSRWLPSAGVVVCDDALINTKTNEKVSVTRVR